MDSGGLTSGEVYQQTTYDTGDRGTFTGFHIHLGGAGDQRSRASSTRRFPPAPPIAANGTGSVGPFYTEIDPKIPQQVLAFANLFLNPGADYINIHTSQHGGGVMRAQLRPTEALTFPVLMSSANEPNGTTVAATAPAVITARVLRNEDGRIAAGAVFFDVDYRLPGAAQITGLHIHDGAAGGNGPVTIGMIPQNATRVFDCRPASATSTTGPRPFPTSPSSKTSARTPRITTSTSTSPPTPAASLAHSLERTPVRFPPSPPPSPPTSTPTPPPSPPAA